MRSHPVHGVALSFLLAGASACSSGATAPGGGRGSGGATTGSGGATGGAKATGGSNATGGRGGGATAPLDAGATGGSGTGGTPGADAGAADVPVVAPDAGADGSLAFTAWPGANMVALADGENAFGTDLSGLVYQPAAAASPAVLWAVNNSSGKLYRLTWNGTVFAPVTTDGWRAGKTLRYPGGEGKPDAEGVTMAEWAEAAVYVAAERDDDDSGTSRLSILRYETAGAATTLTATHEWDLTGDLPKVDSNKGLEGIAWVPDTFLVARGFFDEAAGKLYVPAEHPNHGTGLFFVGLETDGMIYGYALDHTAMTFRRVATFAAGQEEVMDLAFDRDVGTLWSWCDEGCGNRAVLLDIDQDAASPTRGRFRPQRGYKRPSTLGNGGHEGIAIAPESECATSPGGYPQKPFIWADDSNSDKHALRRDLIPCGPLY